MNNQANNSRRKFIKTTGAVAGITVLPSTSVWGRVTLLVYLVARKS